mgnify:CR=1 FL=1
MNFTNEGGVDGTTRFLKNITGMWLLEECRRIWAKEGRTYTYAEIMAMAGGPPAGRAAPPHMRVPSPLRVHLPAAIRDWCRGRGKVPPADDAALVRCIFESLAARYGEVLGNLRGVAPFAIERLHVIAAARRTIC